MFFWNLCRQFIYMSVYLPLSEYNGLHKTSERWTAALSVHLSLTSYYLGMERNGKECSFNLSPASPKGRSFIHPNGIFSPWGR